MLNLPKLQVPLKASPDGRVFVAETEISLEQIVAEFENGAIADEIAARHKELTLADVFLVLSFYLKNRKDVEAYLIQRHKAEKMRSKPKPAA